MYGLLHFLKYSFICYSYGFSLIGFYLLWKENNFQYILSENCLNCLNNLSFKYLTNICFNKKKGKKKNEEDEDDELLCIICQEKRRNILFTKCNHVVCCEDCKKKLFSSMIANNCPMCRREHYLKETKKIYF